MGEEGGGGRRVWSAHSGTLIDSLSGIVVKASTSRTEDPGFKSRLQRDFSGSSHTSDLKTGSSVATRAGAWRYGVNAEIDWSGVSIL